MIVPVLCHETVKINRNDTFTEEIKKCIIAFILNTKESAFQKKKKKKKKKKKRHAMIEGITKDLV